MNNCSFIGLSGCKLFWEIRSEVKCDWLVLNKQIIDNLRIMTSETTQPKIFLTNFLSQISRLSGSQRTLISVSVKKS